MRIVFICQSSQRTGSESQSIVFVMFCLLLYMIFKSTGRPNGDSIKTKGGNEPSVHCIFLSRYQSKRE